MDTENLAFATISYVEAQFTQQQSIYIMNPV